MKAVETNLQGCFIFEPTVYEDERGYFFESYNESKLVDVLGYKPHFVQDNHSKSSYGVIRGLHMQSGIHAQAKLIQVLQGEVVDVALDVRENSPTFGQFTFVHLSEENKKQLFIPRGFLHGFSVLSKSAVFSYKCDNFYHKESEAGINPLDNELNIDWEIPIEKIILSEKDQMAQSFADFSKNLDIFHS